VPRCPRCGSPSVYEAYFMSMKYGWCWDCGAVIDLTQNKVIGQSKPKKAGMSLMERFAIYDMNKKIVEKYEMGE